MGLKYASSACFILVLVSALAGVSHGQQPRQDQPKNLQYFPKDIERSDLISQMRQFSFALGVACTYCHGTAEQTGFNLQGVDFALDLKPTKTKAREMLRMVDTINSQLLPKTSHRSALHLQVTCFTCHSGAPLPEMIEARVLRMIEADDIDAAVSDYRSLRESYFGSAAYNFGEQPLVEVASDLHRKGKYEAAVAISRLNLEFHPTSRQSKFRLAEGYAESGAREQARQIYRELLEERPDDRRLQQRLEELAEPKE